MTKFQNVRKRASAAVVGAASALAAGAAAASGGGFDESTITAKIAENGATAVVIVGAMILALWGIKSMGLLKRG